MGNGIPRAMGERREKEAGARWSGMVALRQHPRTHRLDSSGGTSSPMFAAARGKGDGSCAGLRLRSCLAGGEEEPRMSWGDGRMAIGGFGGDDEATGGGWIDFDSPRKEGALTTSSLIFQDISQK